MCIYIFSHILSEVKYINKSNRNAALKSLAYDLTDLRTGRAEGPASVTLAATCEITKNLTLQESSEIKDLLCPNVDFSASVQQSSRNDDGVQKPAAQRSQMNHWHTNECVFMSVCMIQ